MTDSIFSDVISPEWLREFTCDAKLTAQRLAAVIGGEPVVTVLALSMTAAHVAIMSGHIPLFVGLTENLMRDWKQRTLAFKVIPQHPHRRGSRCRDVIAQGIQVGQLLEPEILRTCHHARVGSIVGITTLLEASTALAGELGHLPTHQQQLKDILKGMRVHMTDLTPKGAWMM